MGQLARPADCPVRSGNPHMCTSNGNPTPTPCGNLTATATVTLTLTLTLARNPRFSLLRSTDGSLRSTRGPAPGPPLNNKTSAVATDRLVCAPPCMHRLVCGPPNHPLLRLASLTLTLYIRGVFCMRGTGVIGRGGYRNEPDSRPAGQSARRPASRPLVRQAGMSAKPVCPPSRYVWRTPVRVIPSSRADRCAIQRMGVCLLTLLEWD